MKELLSILLLFLSFNAFAQENKPMEKNISPQEMATLEARSLTMQLDLTPEQEVDLTNFYRKRVESRKEWMQKSNINQDASKKASEGMLNESLKFSEEEKEELRKIFTAEQYLKWEQLQEKRRKGLRDPMSKN